MKQNKGITLIALVITIIVLLILAGVAISMLSGENGILNQAATAKTETEKKSTEEAVKLAAMSALTVGEGNFKSQEALKVLNDELDKAGYNGDITKEMLEGEAGVTIEIGEEEYTIYENGVVDVPSDKEEKPEGGSSTGITWTYTDEDSSGDISIGDLVSASNEKFYVIGFNEDNTKVKLLAAKCVNTNENKQSDSYSYVAFDAGEWDENHENYYKPGTTTPVTNAYANASIKKLVEDYVTGTLGLNADDGRLMLKYEADALMSEHTGILYLTGVNYWLGSPGDDVNDESWVVFGQGGLMSDKFAPAGYTCGLRPVIEISKDKISQ